MIHGNHILDNYNNSRDKSFVNESEKRLSNVYIVEHVKSKNKGEEYEYKYVQNDDYVLCNNFDENDRLYDANSDCRCMVNIQNPAYASEHTVTLSKNDNTNREIYQTIAINESLSKNHTKDKTNNLALNQNFNGNSTNIGSASEKSYLQRSKELNSILYPELSCLLRKMMLLLKNDLKLTNKMENFKDALDATVKILNVLNFIVSVLGLDYIVTHAIV